MGEKRRFENKVHLDVLGKPLRVKINKDQDDPESPTVDVDVRTEHVLGMIIGMCDMRTRQAGIDAGRTMEAVREGRGKDFIELDIGMHTFIKEVMEAPVMTVWRLAGVAILEFIKEGYEKAHQPAETD